MMRKIAFLFIWIVLVLPIGSPPALHAQYPQDQQLILVGVGAFNDGFYDIAEKQFSRFLKDYPNHQKTYDICYLLGRTSFRKNNFKESKGFFLKILNENKGFRYTDYTLYWLSEAEIRLGNREEARKLLLSLVKTFPKFEWIDYAYYLLGLIDFHSNRSTQAQAAFKSARLSSKNPLLLQSSLFWLGVLSFRQKEYAEAAQYFHTLVEDPAFPLRGYQKYALFGLGEAQLRLGKYAEAKTNFTKFFQRFKDDSVVPEVQWRVAFCDYRLGNHKESIEVFQSLKNQLKESPLLYSTHYLLGKMFFANGDLSASTREINSIVYRSPHNDLTGISFITLFWIYFQVGDTDGANKVFQRLQKSNYLEDEKNFIQWLNAELLFSEGRISDSLPYYFNILNSRYREKTLYQIGRGYFFENKLREAITNLDILLLEFPNSMYVQEALFIRGECLNKLGNLDLALEAYDLIVQQNKNDLWKLLALTQIGNLHMARNEPLKAQKAFKRIIDQFSPHPLYYHAACQLGNLNFKTNNIADAIHYFSLVLKGNILELFGEAHFGLGEIFYQQGKYDKALSSFEAAIRYLGETSLWFFLSQLEIGNLHRKSGKYEEARKAYTLILNHSKDEEMRQAAKILLNQLGSP